MLKFTEIVSAYASPLFGRTVTVPGKFPAASVDGFAATVSVAAALPLEGVTVSHGESEVAVNGTTLPVPIAVSCTVCVAGDTLLPAFPLKVSAVFERCSTGLLVTTSVTGNVKTFDCPVTAIVTVVV